VAEQTRNEGANLGIVVDDKYECEVLAHSS
jgi:hypothetical protein